MASGSEVHYALAEHLRSQCWMCLRKENRNSSGVKIQAAAFTDGTLVYAKRGNNEVRS